MSPNLAASSPMQAYPAVPQFTEECNFELITEPEQDENIFIFIFAK